MTAITALWDLITTLALIAFAYFVPLGPHVPSSKIARLLYVLVPLSLVIFSQYLWATTGRSLVDRLTCLVVATSSSCRVAIPEKAPLTLDSIEVLDQICPAALTNAQDIDRVPYVAKLATLNPQPVSSDHFTCRAEGRGITYFITVKVRCLEFKNGYCAPVTKVETDSGEIIWNTRD